MIVHIPFRAFVSQDTAQVAITPEQKIKWKYCSNSSYGLHVHEIRKETEESAEEYQANMLPLVMCGHNRGDLLKSGSEEKSSRKHDHENMQRSISFRHEKVMLRSDGDATLQSLKEMIKQSPDWRLSPSEKGGKREQVVMEGNGACDSRTIGFIESKIRRVQGQIRAMMDTLESRVGSKIRDDHACLSWTIRQTSTLRSRGGGRKFRNGTI